MHLKITPPLKRQLKAILDNVIFWKDNKLYRKIDEKYEHGVLCVNIKSGETEIFDETVEITDAWYQESKTALKGKFKDVAPGETFSALRVSCIAMFVKLQDPSNPENNAYSISAHRFVHMDDSAPVRFQDLCISVRKPL